MSQNFMDDEAKARQRQLAAARKRAYRAQKNAEGEPKRQRGGQPTDNPHRQRKIYLTDEEWQFCRAQPGGGSEFVRQVMVAYITAYGALALGADEDSGQPGGPEFVKRMIAASHALDEAKALLADPDARDLVAAILEGYRNKQ